MNKFKVGDIIENKGEDMLGVVIDLSNSWCLLEVIKSPFGWSDNERYIVRKDYISIYTNKYWNVNNIDEYIKVSEEPMITKTYVDKNCFNNNDDTTASEKTGGTIMSKVTKFVKNLSLSSEEKLVRKFDLHDENGETTEEGQQVILAKLFASKESQNYLVEIAEGLEAEEKKNK